MKKILARVTVIIFTFILALLFILVMIFHNELQSLASIEKLDEHPLSRMTYYGDYGFDEFLKVGATNDNELAGFVANRLLRGIPINLNLDFNFSGDAGCTVFVVKNEKDEVLYCRNYDFPYTPAIQVFTSPDNGYLSVSTIQSDVLGYSKNVYPTGINVNSFFALAAPYMPWDGMNEKGLAIGLLAVPEAFGPQHNEITLSTTTLIRLVLDKASTVQEAVDLLKRYNVFFSAGINCHFLIADRTGESVLAEYWDGELKLVTTPEDYQVASNFIAYNGINIGEGFNEFERYETAKTAIVENGGYLTEKQVLDLLMEVGIYNGDTDMLQWTVIYNLTKGTGKILANRNINNIHSFEIPSSSNQ